MALSTSAVPTQFGLSGNLSNTVIGQTYSGSDNSGLFQFLGNAFAPKSMEQDYNAYQAAIERMYNAEQAEIARKFNSREARLSRDFQERMSSSAYQRAVADMKRAGINPLLAYSNGGASTPAGSSASSGSASSGSGARSSNNNKSVIFDIIGKVFQFTAGLI